jgi:hypothetical protein
VFAPRRAPAHVGAMVRRVRGASGDTPQDHRCRHEVAPVPHSATSDAAAILVPMTDEQIDSLKDLLRDPLGDIRLEDLVREMTAPVAGQLTEERFSTKAEDLSVAGFAPVWIQQVRDYEGAVASLFEPARLIGSYGLPAHAQVWKQFITPFARWADWSKGLDALVELRGYPALVLLYVTAIASVLRDNYAPLVGIATLPRIRNREGSSVGNSVALVAGVNARSIVGDGVAPIASALAMSDDGTEVTDDLLERLRRGGSRHTPMSDHLHSILRSVFESEIGHNDEWTAAFDRAEVILDALATDADMEGANRMFQTPGGFGRYTWGYRHSDNPIEKQLLAEVERDGNSWAPVSAGLFGGRVDRATDALSSVAGTAEAVRRGQW